MLKHNLRLRLKQFLDLASAVWASYLRVGPGRVDGRLFEGIEELADSLIGFLGEAGADKADETITVAEHVQQVRELCKRCVHHAEGLCFITGEAGLIPRRDLHEAMESSLTSLRELLSSLFCE